MLNFDPIIIIYILTILIIIALVYFSYYILIRPNVKYPGIRKNPKSKRRKIPILRGPEYSGYVIEMIQESGADAVDGNLWTIYVETPSGIISIPHVNPEKDLVQYDIPQSICDADSLIYECAISRNGTRHLAKLEMSSNDSKKGETMRVHDLILENRSLRIELAKIKEELKLSASPEQAGDAMANIADQVTRLKRALTPIQQDMEEQQQQQQGGGSPR